MAALLLFLLLASGALAQEPAGVRADVHVVRSLYDQFAGEAVLDDPGANATLIEQPRAVLTRYFTTELSGLVLAERACAVSTQEVCHLDFSPLWDSQDPGGATVSMAGESSLGTVQVTIHYPDGEKKVLAFRLTKTSAGWRIADIFYPSQQRTLSQMLRTRP